MGKVLVTEDYLSDIADAIREKLGVETTYKPSEMAAAILSISGGGTVSFHGAPYSTVSYTGADAGSVTLDQYGAGSAVLAAGTYTFTNTVTIGEDEYTAAVKTVGVAGDMTVDLVPAGALYWYGLKVTDFAAASGYAPPGSSVWGQNIPMTAGTNCISGTATTSSGTHRDIMWGSADSFDTTGYTYLKARLVVDWDNAHSCRNTFALNKSKSFVSGAAKTEDLGSAEYDGSEDITVMSLSDVQSDITGDEYYIYGNAGSTYNSGTVTVDMKILALWLE